MHDSHGDQDPTAIPISRNVGKQELWTQLLPSWQVQPVTPTLKLNLATLEGPESLKVMLHRNLVAMLAINRLNSPALHPIDGLSSEDNLRRKKEQEMIRKAGKGKERNH